LSWALLKKRFALTYLTAQQLPWTTEDAEDIYAAKGTREQKCLPRIAGHVRRMGDHKVLSGRRVTIASEKLSSQYLKCEAHDKGPNDEHACDGSQPFEISLFVGLALTVLRGAGLFLLYHHDALL
jgi:hypothetical protein